MTPRQPPYGMDNELTQVRMHEYNPSIRPDYYPDPLGKPACYKKSARPCEACPYRSDCANAEGRM